MPIRLNRLKVTGLASLAALFSLSACSEDAGGADATVVSQAAGGAEAALDPIPIMGEEVRILAFGDSLFAGYGLADSEGDSYPSKLEAALRARGINARVTNAGVSGDTSAAGRQRLGFVLEAQGETPDLFILELGGNDLLRGLSPDETRANFSAMLDTLKERDIPVLIMGMRAPPNYGPEYQQAFDALYGELAREYAVDLIPFWLEEIYQEPQLFQDDRIHPTLEGIEALVASTVDEVAAVLPERETVPAE
ncbi:MAG: arylesterase [Erythrobacter sp.]|uniref:arylesterase n=1 Tax=Erythrobacter sp. TaxID=1042 RepID=UPI00260C88E6|nr:arylesterase [Erythrobacter sp.]MDJ0978748.1 arylesterase [Erythrobacter sp.]